MKRFLEYLYEARAVADKSILDKIKNDTTYSFEIIPVTSNGKASNSNFKVLVGKELSSHSKRAEILRYIASTYDGVLIGPEQDPEAVKFPESNIKVVVKPAAKQGNTSDGVDSEYALTDAINAAYSSNGNIPITIIFESKDGGTKQFVCKDIVSAEQFGKKATSFKGKKIKCDLLLTDKDGNEYSLSLKKKGAAWVENGSVYGHDWYVPTIEQAVKDGKTQLTGSAGIGYKLSKTIYFDMTNDEKTSGLFGDDETVFNNCKIAVIEATFDKSTTLKETDKPLVYKIPVDYIITKLSDATGKHDLSWFAINHHGRPGHWRGIYVRAAFMTRANGNTVKVDRINEKKN